MAIMRHAPGERVTIAGRYALVGHYGESTDFSVSLVEGDEFPSITVSADLGPFWFHRVDEADERSRAA